MIVKGERGSEGENEDEGLNGEEEEADADAGDDCDGECMKRENGCQ